ncbi:MAG TPA: dienelactone hydrolase family protein, partial [Mucilaginibacter sp.]
MKKLPLLLLALVIGATTFAQRKKTVCCSNPSSTQRFAMLAADPGFRMAHLKPLPIRFQSSIGANITFKTPDGKESTAYLFKAKKPTDNYILVIHEWWGLNDYVKKESEKLYNDLGNVNVIDIDLYDGKIAATPPEAGKLMQEVNEDRARAIINGAVTYTGAN